MKRLALLLPLLALAAGPVLAEEPADKPPLKVLAIGNSFSQSLCPSLFMAAEDAGEKLEFCNLCIGGCSLERHAENIAKAGVAPGFAPYEATWYRTDGYAKFNANVPQMLATQAWDVVTIQQASHESWNPGSFHPWADAVVAAVRSLAPGAEIVVHETWSYNAADARIGGKFPDWPFDQAGMYSRLETNYLALARSFGLRTIPVGLAVQKRRAALAAAGRGFDPAALDEAKPLQDPDLRGEPVGSFWWDKATAIEPDRPMRRDTIHLNKAGQYLQTMTWLGFLFGRDVRASDGYRPSSDRVARFLGVVDDAAALRSAAQDALDEAKARGWQDFAPKKAGGVSHAESAEWRPTPEQTGRFRFDDKGTVVVAEVDAEGRVRLLENGPDSPPLRIRPATIRNRNLFVVEMDDIPDTGRHWTLALDFDAAKRAWIVVGEGETAADIVPEKPGYRTALFRRLDEPPSAPVP